jgi:hypothetical protein
VPTNLTQETTMNGDRSIGSRARTARRRAYATALLACLTAFALLAASASAQAATVRVRCAGKGGRNADSSGTVLCASSTKGRTIAGVVRDDAGKPVAAKITVTFNSWTPAGNRTYTISPRATREISAKADGTFSITSNPATKESIRFDVVADAALGVSAGAFAQSDVSRQLTVKLAKLGGGVVRFTVKGTSVRPIRLSVLSDSGYPLPGLKPKKVDRKGQATFHLAAQHGFKLTYYVDAGVYNDLFWDQGRPSFKV